MVEPTLLTISIVMGLLTLAFVAGTGRLAPWRRYASSRREPDSRLQRALRRPSTWMIGLLSLCVLVGAGLVVGTGIQQTLGESAILGGLAGVATVLLLVAVPAAYLLWGVYDLARKRGLGNAKAVGLSAWIAGVLFVGMIAITLVAG
jgi:cytochrome c oxidase assembly factor CtaG